MTTQTRKVTKTRIEALADAMLREARALELRAGFFLAPIRRDWEPADPEGERHGHDVFYFVVDGTEEELDAFHRELSRAFLRLTADDQKLRGAVDIETILPNEVDSWRLTRATS